MPVLVLKKETEIEIDAEAGGSYYIYEEKEL